MTVEILFPCWNRRAFVEFTFDKLIANTAWSLVDRLVVYDDGSEDGTREWLQEAILRAPVPSVLRRSKHRSPPATMNDYLADTNADWFAKVDSDIVVPPGWLQALLQVAQDNPFVELLGMEAGRMGLPGRGFDGRYSFSHATHIGGVGLMHAGAMKARKRIPEWGRYGFTEWQHKYEPVRGWITPDLRLCSLDQVPFEPWLSLAADYVDRKWARPWGPYDERFMRRYWDWWADGAEAAA